MDKDSNRKTLKSNFILNDSSPCIKESTLSLNCLEKNNYDHSKCELYFANYRECKKFWGRIVRERRYKGIKPDLPNEEERNRILAEKKSFGW